MSLSAHPDSTYRNVLGYLQVLKRFDFRPAIDGGVDWPPRQDCKVRMAAKSFNPSFEVISKGGMAFSTVLTADWKAVVIGKDVGVGCCGLVGIHSPKSVEVPDVAM